MSARTRRGLALTWSALFVLSMLLQYFSFALASPALAVHDEGLFELDGNATDTNPPEPDDDWDSLNHALDSIFIPGSVEKDGSDVTYFTGGGSKDVNDIPQWKYSSNDVAPDKDEILDAFAAVYEKDGDTFVYFGADRFDGSGDAFIGFWFLQSNIGLGANGSFTGAHVDGDILVLSDFTNGGSIAEIKVYEWIGGELTIKASSATCDVPGEEEACAAVNGVVTDAPWTFLNKSGSSDFAPGEFYEGGVNLDLIFGGDAPCFSTFLAETRSSASTSAQLKDFALGSLSTCVPPTIATTSSRSTADFGQTVTDTATLSGSNGPVTGTVNFFICTPTQITAAGCPEGNGSAVGGAVTIVSGSATSSAYTVGVTAAAAGTYCWRAEYTPATGSEYLAGSHTNATTECFTVAPATIDIVKDANPVGPVSAGTDIGFDIVVTNGGTNTTLGIVVSDPLPTGVDWTLGATSGNTTGLLCSITGSVGSEVLGCTKPSLPALTNNSFTVHVSAQTDATDCGVINNTANVSTSNDGTDSDPASVTVQCPDIKVTKTPDGTSVDAGGTITWTIKVENLGPGAATGVVLTDNLPSGIDWSESEADCSIAGAVGSEVLTCNVGALASGASKTYQVSGTTSKDNCGPVNNTASATATNEPSNVLANNSDSGSVTVLCATVTIGKTADAASVSAGSDIGFTLTWGNSTGGAATGVVVTDNLPGNNGLNWSISATGTTGTGSTCAITGVVGSQVLTCNVGTIPGNTAVSGTVHVVSDTTSASCAVIPNRGDITTTNDGSAFANASVTVLCPDVHVDKTADTGTINAGDVASFTITVSNAGPGVATSVTLTDTLPAGVAWSENSASCAITAGVLSCNFGDLASGASASVTVSGTTDAADCAGLNNTANVAATNEPQADQADNSDSASIVVNCPDVHVLKTADSGTISAGQNAAFTIVVSNAGPGVATNVTLHDVLPTGVTWAIDPAVTGCAIAAGVLDCSFASLGVGAGAAITIHISGATESADCGTLSNTATVGASNEPAADQTDNSSTAVITVQCPDLEVVKSGNGPLNAGETATFTIVVTNHGPGVAFNATLNDQLPSGGWTLGTGGNEEDCSISGSNLLTCDFGALISGATRTITLSKETVAAECPNIHNLVTVAATNEDTANDEFANSDDADITVNCPLIVITKSADAAVVNAGDGIGFVIEVTNTGDGSAFNVHVTDTLPTDAGLAWQIDAANSSAGWSITAGVLSYGPATLAGGSSIHVHIVSVTTSETCGVVPNLASVTFSGGTGEDGSSVTVQCPDVTVVKTPDAGVVNAGENAVFTIVVSNSNAEGTGDAYGVTLTDNLPAGYVWTVGGADGEDCSIDTDPSPDVLSCSFGTLEPGASRTITLTAPTTGDNCAVIPNVATVAASNEAAEDRGNNSDNASIDVTCPDILVIKDAPNTPIQVGGDLVFTITTTNIGDGTANDVVLTDTLPAGFDWDVDSADCAIASGVLTCEFGDMAPGDSITITLSAPTSADAETGNIDCTESLSHEIPNVASASSSNEGESVLENNSDDATIVVNCSSLLIEKTLADTGATDPDLNVPSAEIGDTLDYSLDYTGAGLLENAVITDVLPQGLEYVDGSALGNADFNAGTYDPATRTITWQAKATLPDPAGGTVSYQAIVLATAPEFAQPLVNVATIDSDQTPPDSDTASVAVLAPPLELTPPPTSTITPQTGTSNPGFALMLILLGVAGLTLGIGFITPVPASVRRRERLG